MQWQVQVVTDSSGKWLGNGLLFDNAAEAEAYALRLTLVWTAVKNWRVVAVRAPQEAYRS
jgi:hypothetical protein